MSVASQMAMIEALLYVVGEPVKIEIMMKIIDLNESEVNLALDQLRRKYLRDPESGLALRQIGEAYMLSPKQELLEVVAQYYRPEHTPNLSQAAYETLAVIAYNEPVTKAQIELVRGVNSDSLVTRLLERGLVEERGQLDVVGHPMTFGVTTKFLAEFGLTQAADLPPIDLLQLDTVGSLNRGEDAHAKRE